MYHRNLDYLRTKVYIGEEILYNIIGNLKRILLINCLPNLLYNGYRVFPGGKVRPGRAAHHSRPSSAAVMEE